MRLLLTAAAVLSFLSVGHTAPTISCESLTQRIPIENREQLLGKWMFVGESANIPGIKSLTKKYVDSGFVNVTNGPESNTINFFQSQKSFGSCISFSSTSLLANNSLQMTKPYKAIEFLLTTGCPDCLVFQGNFTLGTSYYQSLQLLSRRRMLSSAELEEFKKQADCLKLPPPVIMDPEKELCSEEQATSATDITSMLNSDVATQVLGMLESIINSQDGLTGFFDNFIGNRAATKQR